MAFEKVADLDGIEIGTAVKVYVSDEPIAVVRISAERVKAVHNVCSHQHYDLAPEGWVGDNSIECAKHGSTFDLDTGVPDTLPAVAPIPVYACKVEGGAVLVDVKQQLNDATVPRH